APNAAREHDQSQCERVSLQRERTLSGGKARCRGRRKRAPGGMGSGQHATSDHGPRRRDTARFRFSSAGAAVACWPLEWTDGGVGPAERPRTEQLAVTPAMGGGLFARWRAICHVL